MPPEADDPRRDPKRPWLSRDGGGKADRYTYIAGALGCIGGGVGGALAGAEPLLPAIPGGLAGQLGFEGGRARRARG